MNYAVQDFAYGVTVAQTETDNHTSRQFVGEDNHKITCKVGEKVIIANKDATGEHLCVGVITNFEDDFIEVDGAVIVKFEGIRYIGRIG